VDPYLQQVILDRLTADDQVDDRVADLVLAACEGRDALEIAIGGEAPDRPSVSPSDAPRPEPPGAYVKSITVEGFRGIGAPATLQLSPGPGFTLVVGRNGSGKSSFAEGLETLLTGANLRWESRTKVWREGWQNIHHTGSTTLAAELYVDEQPGLLRVARTWPHGSDVKAANECTALLGDGTPTTLSELGWDVALSRYRPFLSYAELGAMFDELATMYDALAAILGLEEAERLADELRAARLPRERAFKDFKAERDGLLERLAACDDERAAASVTALRSRTPDFAALELALEGLIDGGDPEGELERLRRLARLSPPDAARVEEAVAALERSAVRLDALQATDAAREAAVADLLDAALGHHELHDDPHCPVCGTRNVLDAAWVARATAEVRERRTRAREYEAARNAAATARRALEGLAGTLDADSIARLASEMEIEPGSIVQAWARWRGSIDGADGHHMAPVRRAYSEMAAAVTALVDLARAEVDRRDDAWRPIAADVRAWVPDAEAAVAGQQQLPDLKAAEKWAREAAAELQAERLAPIANAAKANWDELRQESNVSLDGFWLRKSGNVRRAEVAVSIDGSAASAFGVMSQGELHSLAVSVFLPRAGFRDSPFRFMVIDDPVQSMDPSKVDGLARVLAGAAKDRQVIAFTHDERLPEAVRRLGLDAMILEVTRRPESIVEVRPALDPVERHLDDARALIRSEEVPRDVVARVVPGFCRLAIEAASAQAIRRRRLSTGSSHADVEAALGRCTTVMMILALALFDDETKGGQVLASINNRFGVRAGDAVRLANRGVHQTVSVDLRDLVRDSAVLARQLADLS
jgi:recombinational DNA repair ATPase RecF